MTKFMPWILMVVCLASKTFASVDVEIPWWLSVRFQPAHSSADGIPVENLNHEWEKVSILTSEMLPPEAFMEGESMEENGGDFSVEADFDNNGSMDRAVVGVYKTKNGLSGRFLLITTIGLNGNRIIMALFAEEGTAGFGNLTYDKKSLFWWFCMQCDDGYEVHYKSGKYSLEYLGDAG